MKKYNQEHYQDFPQKGALFFRSSQSKNYVLNFILCKAGYFTIYLGSSVSFQISVRENISIGPPGGAHERNLSVIMNVYDIQ